MDTEKVKKPSRGIGKFFLGWFIGFVFTLALLAGLGYWFYKCGTIKGLENTFKFNISALDEDSKNMTIENLIGNVLKVATNYKEMSLEEIADSVGLNLQGTLTVTNENGVKKYSYKTIDVTDVIKGKISEINANFNKVVDSLTLGELENAFELTLPNITLINEVKGSPIKELGDVMNDVFRDYTLNEISTDFDVSFNNVEMLKNLLDIPLYELGTEINNLTIADVFDVTKPGTSKILISIKDSKITDLSNTIKTLTLSQMLDVTNNNFLVALQDSTIDSLSNDISNLKVSDVFDTTSSDASKFLVALKDKKILEIDTAFDTLKISDILDVEIVSNPDYQPGVDPEYKEFMPQGVWAYIDTELLLKDLENQVKGISFSNKTLGELQYQGLISSSVDLTKTLSGSTSIKTLAEYTLDEILQEITK